MNNEITVLRYRFRLLFRFLSARSPSMPNSLRTNFHVLTCRVVSFMSVVCLIASMGDIFELRHAGIYAEIIMVTVAKATAAITERVETDSVMEI